VRFILAIVASSRCCDKTFATTPSSTANSENTWVIVRVLGGCHLAEAPKNLTA
jgi:hypothetical protein